MKHGASVSDVPALNPWGCWVMKGMLRPVMYQWQPWGPQDQWTGSVLHWHPLDHVSGSGEGWAGSPSCEHGLDTPLDFSFMAVKKWGRKLNRRFMFCRWSSGVWEASLGGCLGSRKMEWILLSIFIPTSPRATLCLRFYLKRGFWVNVVWKTLVNGILGPFQIVVLSTYSWMIWGQGYSSTWTHPPESFSPQYSKADTPKLCKLIEVVELCVKDQIVHVLGFSGHMWASVAATQLCSFGQQP